MDSESSQSTMFSDSNDLSQRPPVRTVLVIDEKRFKRACSELSVHVEQRFGALCASNFLAFVSLLCFYANYEPLFGLFDITAEVVYGYLFGFFCDIVLPGNTESLIKEFKLKKRWIMLHTRQAWALQTFAFKLSVTSFEKLRIDSFMAIKGTSSQMTERYLFTSSDSIGLFVPQPPSSLLVGAEVKQCYQAVSLVDSTTNACRQFIGFTRGIVCAAGCQVYTEHVSKVARMYENSTPDLFENYHPLKGFYARLSTLFHSSDVVSYIDSIDAANPQMNFVPECISERFQKVDKILDKTDTLLGETTQTVHNFNMGPLMQLFGSSMGTAFSAGISSSSVGQAASAAIDKGSSLMSALRTFGTLILRLLPTIAPIALAVCIYCLTQCFSWSATIVGGISAIYILLTNARILVQCGIFEKAVELAKKFFSVKDTVPEEDEVLTPQFSFDADTAGPLIAMLTALGLKTTDGKPFNLLDFFSDVGRGSKGAGQIFMVVLTIIEKTGLDLNRIMGIESVKDLDVEVFMERVVKLSAECKVGLLLPSASTLSNVHDLHEYGRKLAATLKKNKKETDVVIVNRLCSNLETVYKEIQQKLSSSVTARPMPITTVLQGLPKQGKSLLARFLTQFFFFTELEDIEDEAARKAIYDAYRARPGTYCYVKGQDYYYDGVDPRMMIMLFDDWLQRRTVVGGDYAPLMDLIAAANTEPWFPRCAFSKEEKCCAPKYIIATTNRPTFHDETIAEPDAAYRRLDFVFEVTLNKPADELQGFDIDQITLTRKRWVPSKASGSDFKKDPQRGCFKTSGVYTVRQFVAEALALRAERKREFESVTDDMTKHIGLIREKLGLADFMKLRGLCKAEAEAPKPDMVPGSFIEPQMGAWSPRSLWQRVFGRGCCVREPMKTNFVTPDGFTLPETDLFHDFELETELGGHYKKWKAEFDKRNSSACRLCDFKDSFIDSSVIPSYSRYVVCDTEMDYMTHGRPCTVYELFNKWTGCDMSHSAIDKCLSTVHVTREEMERWPVEAIQEAYATLDPKDFGLSLHISEDILDIPLIDRVKLSIADMRDEVANHLINLRDFIVENKGTVVTLAAIAAAAASGLIYYFSGKKVDDTDITGQSQSLFAYQAKQRAKQPTRRIPKSAFAAAPNFGDETLGSIAAVMRKNMFYASAPVNQYGDMSARFGIVNFFNTNLCHMPYHFIDSTRRKQEAAGIPKELQFMRLERATGDQTIDVPFDSFKILNHDAVINDKAICVIEGRTVQARDVLKHYMNEATNGQQGYRGAAYMPGALVSFDRTNELEFMGIDKRVVRYPMGKKSNGDEEMEYREIENLWRYSFSTVPGDCGILLFALDGPSPVVCGAHVAGMSGQKAGYSYRITSDEVRVLVGITSDQEDCSILESLESAFVQEVLVEKPQEITVHGVPYDPNCHQHVMTFSAQPISGTRTGDSLVLFEGPEPPYIPIDFEVSHTQASNYPIARAPYCVDMEARDAMASEFRPILDIIGQQIIAELRSIKTPCSKRCYTAREAICGFPGTAFKSIDFGTSAGYPWAPRGIKKKDIVYVNEKGMPVVGKYYPEFLKRIVDLCACLRDGDVPIMVHTDVMKVEWRSKAKAVKPRLVSSAPFDAVVVGRMLFGDFMKFMAESGMDSETLIGFDPYTQSEEFTQRLLRFGLLNNCGCADYKGFDTSHSRVLMEVAVNIINGWYGSNQSVTDQRKLYMSSIYNSWHVRGPIIERWEGSMPSGCVLTTLINCLINKVLARFAFWNTHDRLTTSIAMFQKVVEFQCLGDDNVVAVHPDHMGRYNELTIAQSVALLGYTMTSADKTRPLCTDLVPATKVEMLKRTPRYEPLLGHHVLPITLKTVLAIPLRTKTTFYNSIAIDNLENSLHELALHEPEAWDEWFPKMSKFFAHLYVPRSSSRQFYLEETTKSGWFRPEQ